MPNLYSSRRDPALSATILSHTPLLYREGADAAADRPAHVRAGSGLIRLGGRLAVIQDDALFVALLDPSQEGVSALALPAGEGGLRQFDEGRGNKKFKLDLEACIAIPWDGEEALLAFGSGSTARRETLVLTTAGGQVRMIEAAGFYALLREATDFSGSELNLEGAAHAEGCLYLFNRGNGAARDGLLPVNAVGEMDFGDFLAYLESPDRRPAPALRDIAQWDLGVLNGGKLSFTDAVATRRGILYTASAEESPDAVQDGRVTGSALGLLGLAGDGRWIELQAADGSPFPHKVEGLCPAGRDDRLYVVVDVDDPARPSELYEVELAGSW